MRGCNGGMQLMAWRLVCVKGTNQLIPLLQHVLARRVRAGVMPSQAGIYGINANECAHRNPPGTSFPG